MSTRLRKFGPATLALLLLGSVTAQTALPFNFSAGTPARADDVNANFNALNTKKFELGQTLLGNGTGVAQAKFTVDTDGALHLRGRTTETGNAAMSTFQVDKTGGLLATGQIGLGPIPATGAGWRMMWYPNKVAFRAGYADAEGQFDEHNIGYYSWAGGALNVAAGIYSFAMGNQNTVEESAQCGMALGSGNKIFGSGSDIGTCGVAMGLSNKIYDHVGVTLGQGNVSDGDLAIALGYRSFAYGDYSMALGYRASTCSTTPTTSTVTCSGGRTGAFVYGDASIQGYMNAVADNEFAVRAAGGVRFRTKADQSTGCNLPAGSGVWSCTSDKHAKEAFRHVDAANVLEKVLKLPVTTWTYKSDASGARHMGPTAQDFYAAFGLGGDNKTIGHLDQAGVAYAAIQGLDAKLSAEVAARDEKIEALEAGNAKLAAENAALKARLGDILDRLARLERAAD